MTHALPTPGQAAVEAGTAGTPDLFSERTHATARWAVPVLLGLVYGYWAAANRRDGGAITGWNVLFGLVTAIVFAVVMAALLRVSPRLKREVHAVMWFAFTGAAFGFVYSETGASILRSSLMGLAVGVVAGATLFYWYYTHEDAEGHHLP
ncbi:hypothetical protein [Streptomyces sp. YIM S03343]